MNKRPSKSHGRSAGKKGGVRQIELIPDRTVPLTVNGKTIEVHAGAKTKLPPEYKAVYDQSR